MANNGILLYNDLIYVARFYPTAQVPTATLYYVTWEHIRRRALQPSDLLLVQRGTDYYQVAIGDYWTGNKTIDKDTDFFLVERIGRGQLLTENQGLHYVQFEIPSSVMWAVTGLGRSDGNNDRFAFSYDITMGEIDGLPPKLVYPDGTEHLFAPGSSTRIESNQLGVYRLEGTVKQFQGVGGRNFGEIDFSLSSGAAWAKVTEDATTGEKLQFGKRMFYQLSKLEGIPSALKPGSCVEMFLKCEDIACSLETFDVSDVEYFQNCFNHAGQSVTLGIDNWDVSSSMDMTSMFQGYQGDDMPNSWEPNPRMDKYQFLYKNAKNIVGPVIWTGKILNDHLSGSAPTSQCVEMFAGCDSLLGPVHIPVIQDAAQTPEGWHLNKMFENCISLVQAPVFANHPTKQANATAGTNAKFVNQAEFMFRNCHKLNDRSCREWQIGILLFKSRSMFENCHEFDADLSQWYMGGVQTMDYMFRGCKVFNTSLSEWRTGACTNYAHMFDGCEIYNQPMGEWRTRKAKNMISMFANCEQFDQDISTWCVPEIPSKPADFDRQTAFQDEDLKQPDWGNCDPYQKSVELLGGGVGTFLHGRSTEDIYVTFPDGREREIKGSNEEFSLKLDANGWYGIDGMEHFTSIRWSKNSPSIHPRLRFSDTFDVSNISDFSKCFDGMSGMRDDANIGRWDVSNATNMHAMFRGCRDMYYHISGSYTPSPDWLPIQGNPSSDISVWDTSKVTNMSQMFKDGKGQPRKAGNFRYGMPTWNWDTSLVTNMYEMFMDHVSDYF